MKCWIEISGEYRFEQKLVGKEGLYAPSSTRYINMLGRVNPGDIVLHYITSQRALNKEHKSAIIGISKTSSSMIDNGSRLTVDLVDVKRLPTPIKIHKIADIKEKSSVFQKALVVNFQLYLAEITTDDLKNILIIHTENLLYIGKINVFKHIL